jgi:POT family proton-dependent oligopeptide transporter
MENAGRWIFARIRSFMFKKMLQRYPDGIFSMLFIQMFSLVSFAMLFSLLTLYAVHVLHLSDQKAYDISATFNAQTFAMAVLGGYIGNRFLGYRIAFIFSGILAIIGLALLSTNLSAFYYGLAIYTMAQGIMVPAMFVLLGMLYEDDHPDRDSGFIISYIGMNIGSFIATMVAGPISERYGYWLAFLIGLIFAVLALVNYLIFQYQFKPKKITALTRAHADKIHFKDKCLGILIVLVTIPALAYLIQMPQWNNFVLGFLGAFCLLLMMAIVLRQKDPLAKKRMTIFIFLNVASLMFWALYLLMPTVMPLFTERNVNREILQHMVPTATFFASNPLLIMFLGPLFSMIWLRLSKQGKTFSAASKFSLGFVLMAVGYLALALGVARHNALGLMAWQWLILSYFLQTSGELFVAPIGLAMVGTLAPREFEGLMMGIWQLSTGVAGVLTNALSKLVNFDDKTALLPKLTMPAYQHLFILCGSLMLGVALITLCLLPYLNKLNKGSYESILK